MPKSSPIYYVTSNAGKFQEVSRFIKTQSISFNIEQKKLELIEIQSDNQEEIARHKAQQAWDAIQAPVLVDDVAFYIDKYHLFPGTICKQVYYGLGFEGLCKLYEPGEAATRRLTLVYQTGPNEQHVFEGVVTGTLCYPFGEALHHPKLPFNAIFIPTGTNKTRAQLEHENETISYSERIRALEKFLDFIKAH